MRVTVVPGDRLTSEHLACWSDLQQADPSLASPFFRPEFIQAVASVRNGVAVGVLEEEHRTVGFFPFQHGWMRVGRPVGTPLSDFHGVIASPDIHLNAEDLVRASDLAAWSFDHLLAEQQLFCRHHRSAEPSPFLDLSNGFEKYQEDLRLAGSHAISKVLRKIRAAEKHVGPVRLEFHTTDSRVFETLLQWKSAQFLRTKYTNIFRFPWVVRLLERIREHQEEAFGGVLSALYLGDRLAAVHFGMRSYGVLHYWFPAYDPELGEYSPGTMLLVQLARAASSFRIRRIDRSRGFEQHKTSLMSGAVLVAEGSVVCRPLVRVLLHAWHKARLATQVPVLGLPARLTARVSRPLRRWLMLR